MSHLGNVLEASQRECEQMIESAQFESRFPLAKLLDGSRAMALPWLTKCSSLAIPLRIDKIVRVFSAEEGP
jgi:hypothetical protein